MVSDDITGIIKSSPQDDQVPVRLFNPSPYPVILHQNTTLHMFTQVDDKNSVKPNPEVFQIRSVHEKQKSPKSSKTKLTQLFNWEGANIDQSHMSQLEELFTEFEDVVSKDSSDLGQTSWVRHHILMGDVAPIKQSPWQVTFHWKDEMEKNLKSMLDDGVVQPSSSPWASPVVLMKKY